MMLFIAIPYFTGSGHTLRVAQEISNGIKEFNNINVELVDVSTISKIDWTVFHNADAIIFGAPTYMGGLAGQFKIFLDEASHFWLDRKWKDKISAGFTIGTSASGDKLNSLIQLSVFAAQHGMIWVGQSHVGSQHTHDSKRINDTGSWLGLSATSNPDKNQMIYEHDALTANMFGKRIADITRHMKDIK